MKKFSFKAVLVSLATFMLLIATACGGGSSEGENAGGAEGDNGGEQLVFKLGHMNSPEHVQDTQSMRPWSEEVLKLTDGRVKFQIYPGGALGGPVETYDNIITGIMDAGWGLQGYVAGKFPVHSVMNLPFMADGTGEELSIVAQKLYDEFPAIQKEYADVKPLWFHAADPYAIVTKGVAVRSFEDVKGLKLRSPSAEGKAMIESWGATPVSMPAPEAYDALSKGVIDGAIFPVAAIADFNLFDVVDYVTLGNFNTSVFFVLMNKDSWAKIPAEDQAIIEETLGLPMAKKSGAAFDVRAADTKKKAEEMGIEFITLEDSELQKFKDAASGIADQWIKDMEANGVPGQEIYDRARELIEGK